MKLINIKNLTKIYHTKTSETKALDNISLDITDESITSIFGPSGAGKSTLLNLITKFENPTNGYIRSNKKLVIGYMMQTDALLPWLTVYENAILGLTLRKEKTKENLEYVNELLKKYDLDEFRNEYPDNLSGGMRQRLALIRTIAIKPNILLLDEPFSKLDVETRKNIRDDVFKIIKELKICTILISHDIDEVISLSDEIYILTKRPGKIKAKYYLNFNDLLPSKRCNDDIFNKLYESIRCNTKDV